MNGPDERVVATYLVETALPVEQAAEVLAGEQSCGTFVAVPGETAEIKRRFAARVEGIDRLGEADVPSLPGATAGAKYHRARLRVSWPTENFGANLPALVSTLQGNLYELRQFSGLRLVDIEFPETYLGRFAGPKFGVAGTRALAGGAAPLMGTIIKPSLGLTPQETADLVRVLVRAGIDFIKDDELLADPAFSPRRQRIDAVMRVIREEAQRSGRQALYACNLSGDLDSMLRDYDYLVAAGGTCGMISLNTVGLTATQRICSLGQLTLHGHRNGWGMLNRHPLLGMEFGPYQKLWRLAGVDQLHVNGIANKFWEGDDSVVASIEACLAPLGRLAPILPVISSGQWGGQAPETYRRTKTTDVLYLAGGGIMAHPRGPAAGVGSLRTWWRAAVEGLDREGAVARYPELAASVEKFGS